MKTNGNQMLGKQKLRNMHKISELWIELHW